MIQIVAHGRTVHSVRHERCEANHTRVVQRHRIRKVAVGQAAPMRLVDHSFALPGCTPALQIQQIDRGLEF